MLKLIKGLVVTILCSILPAASFGEDIRTLKIYTTRSLAKTIEKYVQKDFEEKNNCKLKILNSQGIEAIITEINLSKAPRGDMVIGLSYDTCRDVKFKKHFKEIPLNNYQKKLNLPVTWEDTQFVPLQLAFLTFIYNKDIVKEPLRSFDDLIKTKHKIILSDPRTSTPGQSLLYWIKAVYADESDIFWKNLKPRILTITKSWSDAYSLFLKAEAPIVISYTTSELYHKLREHKHNIAASHFNEGQYMEVLIGGVLNTSANQDLAQKFLMELLQEPFQKAVVFDSWCYPVIKLAGVPNELNTHPKFINVTAKHDWSLFKSKAVDEWLESLSS